MRRTIRLKEFAPSSVVRNIPPDWYIQWKGIEQKQYILRTDAHGFIVSGPNPVQSERRLVILGDSVVEGMFVDETARFTCHLERMLNEDASMAVQVLNAGYGGATLLHLYNVFVNKIIPLHPVAVVLVTSIVDAGVAIRKRSFWSTDCWLEPIVDLDVDNTARDNDFLSAPVFSDREKILSMFQLASALFEIPVWYATVPHRQVFEGEYARKNFPSQAAFDDEVASYRRVNASTRKFALERGLTLFDLEVQMSDLHQIFYDMFHYNSESGAIVANHFLEAGLREAVAKRLSASTMAPT